MDFEKYKNSVPYPKKPSRPFLDHNELDPEVIRKHADLIEHYNKQMESYRQLNAEYHREEAKLMRQFKFDALTEVGLIDHPKGNGAFEASWNRGHASGLSEVYSHLEDYAELLLD